MSVNSSTHVNLEASSGTTPGRKPPIMTQLEADIALGVVDCTINSIISLFGICANIINIIIFYKQGFKNVVNITFFAIALSDLGAVITLEWNCISMYPALREVDIPFVFDEVYYPVTALPHVMFSRLTTFFTAFVTIERCLGVLIPLKVHRIITPRRTVITLCLMFIVNVMSFVPEYFVATLQWKFYPARNRTQLGLVYISGSGQFLAFIFASPLGVLSFVTVIVFTAILVFQLNQKSKWRRSVTYGDDQEGSTKEKSTMKMVIVIASVLTVCNIPAAIVPWVTVAEPEFHTTGDYVRLFKVVWAFPLLFQGLNSSVNIFFYYRMSTNYRQSFRELLSSRFCKF